MTADAAGLADRLLEAHVAWLLGELSGTRFAKAVARDVDDLLTIAGTLTVRQVVDPAEIKQLARTLGRAGEAPILADLLPTLTDTLYDLAAADDHLLGDVIEREPVVALIAKMLSMQALQERALDRMAESEMATTVAMRFASKIVGDFVQQNRARAERVPGMGSLLSIGTSAASRMKSVSDRALDPLIGEATMRGKVVALKATTTATRDLIDEGLLQEAALELWDLHASEPVSDLRAYMDKEDLHELAELIGDLLASAQDKELVGHALDACVDAIFERYGGRDLASLLPELAVTRDDLVDDVVRFGSRLLDAAKQDGSLERYLRDRLAPFYRSQAFADAVARPVPAPRKPRPCHAT